VNTKLTGLIVAGASILTPWTVLAASSRSPNVMYVVTNDDADLDATAKELDARTKELGAQSKDLDAQLADARARLEEAAHEVAELSSQMSGPLMDHMMSIYDGGPPRAVLGVQLEERAANEGARVREVSPGGAAADAGLRVGDVITSVNGTDIKGNHAARQVLHAMRDVEPESKVKVRVLRDGKSQEFLVTARPGMSVFNIHPGPIPPIPPLPPMEPGRSGNQMFGPVFFRGPLGEMELVSLTPQLGRYFGTDKGVLVVRAPKDFKLEDGDVILAIDGRTPSSGSHATRILGSYQPGEKISIKVMRQQKTVNVETALPERGPQGPGPERVGPGGKVRLDRRMAGPEAAT